MLEQKIIDTPITRRRLLGTAGAIAAVAALPLDPPRARPLMGGGMPARPVAVHVEVASDSSMRRVVRRGTRFALREFGHSLHVDLRGLRPGREYWYRFRVGDEQSPIGRAPTAPAQGARVDALRFAFVSCQDWQDGYYTACDALAREDLDLVVHLGDYIYEYGPEAKTRPASPASRLHDGPEVGSLDSYRNRYALYRSDPALQAAHALCPWIVTRDDREVENNYAGLIREDDVPPGDFAARRAAAYQAYFEHMPLRDRALPSGRDARIYRRLGWVRSLASTFSTPASTAPISRVEMN